MKKKILLPLCVSFAFLLVACAKQDVTTNRSDSPSAVTSSPTPVAVLSVDKIGVPECDDFIAAYDACVTGKVPEAARAQYKTAIEQWRTSWKKLAENPQTRASLVQACKQSAEQARTSMKAYDCTF